MRLYRIDLDYVKNLYYNVDKKVQYNENKDDNYNEKRPYVGIVITINGVNFYAPLEHPRLGHRKLKSNPNIIKIRDGRLGVIGIGNMIPVPESKLIDFDINDVEDANYANILKQQAIFCKKKKPLIQSKAEATYEKVVVKKEPFFIENCCDFEHLIKEHTNYI